MISRTAKVSDNAPAVEEIGRLLSSALDDAADCPEDMLVSYTVPADGLSPGGALAAEQECFFWQRPAAGKQLVGLGTAARIEAIGRDRFEQLSDYFQRLQARWIQRPLGADAPPAAFVGFSFDPTEPPGAEWHGLSNTLLTVPALLYRQDGEHGCLTFTARGATARNRDRCVAAWLEQLAALRRPLVARENGGAPVRLERIDETDLWPKRIDRALDAIRQGPLDKIVLTRKVTYSTSRSLDGARILDSLRAGHEECALIAVARPGCTLIGVSPERLVSCSAGSVVVDALAGTAPRGADADEDRRLAATLLDDSKVAEEHRLVVEQIRDALEPLCTDLVVPRSPGLMRLPQIQHVWTPLRGQMLPRADLLKLAERLHPTPAVGGSPRAAALAWLAGQRRPPRGWYTGAFGWLDRQGEGELSVVLRCGLVNERTVDLFAGAGIVSRSQPETELAETEWKLLTMRGALQLG